MRERFRVVTEKGKNYYIHNFFRRNQAANNKPFVNIFSRAL